VGCAGRSGFGGRAAPRVGRWAASYDPARKVTYVSWFLGTIAYFLDKLDFTPLVQPPVETKYPVFIAEPPSAPIDPFPPPCSQALAASSPSAAARHPGQPVAPAAPAAKPARQSRLWNAGPAALAVLEARNAAERQAQRPQRLRLQDPAPLRAGPGSGGTTPRSGQLDNDIIFLCEDDEDDANEASPTIQFMSPKDDTNDEAWRPQRAEAPALLANRRTLGPVGVLDRVPANERTSINLKAVLKPGHGPRADSETRSQAKWKRACCRRGR
jgi:hypothetical protein